jgi:hypothetical protein
MGQAVAVKEDKMSIVLSFENGSVGKRQSPEKATKPHLLRLRLPAR